ncbi:MAG: 4Fe-4S dicluster domain-containing protein [Thermodesulfobacteriota bacterium]
MAVRSNPNLLEELKHYGADDVSKCFHCGNCTATCPLSKEPFLFPRKSMRYLQMGLGDKLKGNLEPWLCYYCGDCSEQCPREAEPGETMMSMRRWLTSKYDITGLSRLFYESPAAEVLAILALGALTGIGFYWFGLTFGGGDFSIYSGEKAFLPAHTEGNFFGLGLNVHTFDWLMGAFLGGLLAVNCLRMWWFTTGSRKDMKVPPGTYIKNAILLPWHFITQKRYSECEKKTPWVVHLILMLSYLTLLVLIMVFLHHMHAAQTHWVHIFGYAATVGLLGTTLYAMNGRWKKTEAHYKYSHESDMIFLYMLLYVGTTGILQNFAFRVLGNGTLANFMYIVHMMGVVPMLVLEVPFSKWGHLAYRPYAMYLAAVQADVLAQRDAAKGIQEPALVPQKQMIA